MFKFESHGLTPNSLYLFSPDVNLANTQPFASSQKQPCRVTAGPPDLLKNELLNSMTPSHPGTCAQAAFLRNWERNAA